MKKLFKIAIIASVIVTGCTSEETTRNLEENYKVSELRSNLIENKTISQIKIDYGLTLTSDKIAIWQNKLDQLKSLNLPTENLRLIDKLSQELQNYSTSKQIEAINTIAEQLAKITPIDDYVKMFASLEDFKFNGEFEGNVMAIDYFDLFEVKNNFEISPMSSTMNSTASRIAQDCNCRWTCGELSGSHSNCNETSVGCGFLWLGSCTGRY